MDIARIMETLRKEYGIHSRDEFEAAVSEMKGIDIGIFTTPVFEGREADEQKEKAAAVA